MSDDIFKCQRCKLPLQVHDSLVGLSSAQTNLLINSRNSSRPSTPQRPVPELKEEVFIPKERLDLFAHVSKLNEKPINSAKLLSESGYSFVQVPELPKNLIEETSQEAHNEYDNDGNRNSISNRSNSLDTIFKILSSKYEIDYPVCTDCATLLIENLKLQFDQSTKEKDKYLQFLTRLKTQPGPNQAKTEESLDELENLKLEEEESIKQLKELEQEKLQLEKELAEVTKDYEVVDVEVKKFWQQKNQVELEIKEFRQERDKIKSLYEFNLNQLDKLRKTNVYNDTFNISHDGQFGTINGLRLGSLESCRVSWHEINAALGQVILLLATLTNKLNFKLEGYRLKPIGSTSKIEKIESDTNEPGKQKTVVLEVYSSGDYAIERIFSSKNFDSAMVALLEVVNQIGKKLKEIDPTIDLPYEMVKDKIGGASIKLASKVVNDDWTNACKMLLTNLKWVVAYTSIRSRTKSVT